MATKDVMHLVNQFSREPQKSIIAGLPKEAEKVTDRERIGPEIAARSSFFRRCRWRPRIPPSGSEREQLSCYFQMPRLHESVSGCY